MFLPSTTSPFTVFGAVAYVITLVLSLPVLDISRQAVDSMNTRERHRENDLHQRIRPLGINQLWRLLNAYIIML